MLPIAPRTTQDSQFQTNAGSLLSRNITVKNHRTSVRLEPEMWSGLKEICRREHASMHELCTIISGRKPAGASLTAAIRVFVMAYFRAAATEDGHSRAGHGPGGSFMMTIRPFRTGKSLPPPEDNSYGKFVNSPRLSRAMR